MNEEDRRTTPGAGGAGHISGVGFAPYSNARIEPHDYVPSTLHMGDCAVCGHLQHAAIHTLLAEKQSPEVK